MHRQILLLIISGLLVLQLNHFVGALPISTMAATLTFNGCRLAVYTVMAYISAKWMRLRKPGIFLLAISVGIVDHLFERLVYLVTILPSPLPDVSQLADMMAKSVFSLPVHILLVLLVSYVGWRFGTRRDDAIAEHL